MTEYQLKIIFVLILCAPVVYFGVRFFMSLVNNAIAGKKMPVGKDKPAVDDARMSEKRISGRRTDRPGRRG
jgi:hypothetical protein